MDDSEYYSMMRRQYSHSEVKVPVKSTTAQQTGETQKTPGTFSQWSKEYGHEDAEMFLERNSDLKEGEESRDCEE